MPINFLSVFIIGASGIIAQMVLLRELLVGFYGNELSVGIILSNWVATEALGVFIAGALIGKIRRKDLVFGGLVIVFAFSFLFSLFFCRIYKTALGLSFGEGIGIVQMFFISLGLLLPVSFSHGALFSVSTKLYAAEGAQKSYPIGKIYAWETIGTVIGGILFTYVILPFCGSFWTAFIIIETNLLLLFFLFRQRASAFVRAVSVIFLLLGILFAALDGGGFLERASLALQWRGGHLLSSHNSVYGNIVITKLKDQYTFYYNGNPLITSPHTDQQFVEEFGHLPLLFQGKPKRVLVLGAGAGGLIHEILKYPISHLDYAELDPLIIEMVRKYPTAVTAKELSDPRVKVVATDGRFLLKEDARRYDVILIGFSNQSDLATNRLFTREFFALAKTHLAERGVFALWLSGNASYMSSQLSALNGCVFHALKEEFSSVRVIPGDYNIFMASPEIDLNGIQPFTISERLAKIRMSPVLLIPGYLAYRLDARKRQDFERTVSSSPYEVNRDMKPVGVFYSFLLANKKFSFRFPGLLEKTRYLRMRYAALFLLGIMGISIWMTQRRKVLVFPLVYSIAVMGFFTMFSTLILIFIFQILYGNLYHHIGILVSLFMGGSAVGSMMMTTGFPKIRKGARGFIFLEAGGIVYTLLLLVIVPFFSGLGDYAFLAVVGLFLLCGCLAGMQFSLASRLYQQLREDAGEVAGVLYGADLMGGWAAGILGGVILIPLAGVVNSCILLLLFKLSSL
ncbi:MAG: fused MFS/spermidine synthase, partial [Candidatus Omnitrophica bacterium]|nr:fused MFS/spermidine synthase [Candidatus Omnitrophota bacterium]